MIPDLIVNVRLRGGGNRAYLPAFAMLFSAVTLLGGCAQEEGIIEYKVPKKVPEQLLPENDRLLATIVPRGNKVWFFKVRGSKSSVDLIDAAFRSFVENIQFDDRDEPILKNLPKGWLRGGKKTMRFATIDINTSKKQLDLSISFLTGPPADDQAKWDAYVVQNVDRWRGQVGLKPSSEKWAGGEPIKVAQAQGPAVWVDVIGLPDSGGPPMGGMAGGMPMMPRGMPAGPGPGSAEASSPAIEYDGPGGWREQEASGMREVEFELGEADASAEVTVITAGGDLRSNVARWMGQVAGEAPDGAAVDEMLAAAEKFEVSGLPAQRFIIAGDPEKGQNSIDATIVQWKGSLSKFIKMTGHPKTVAEESESMRTFLDSLSF